jgi:hypothetical protein
MSDLPLLLYATILPRAIAQETLVARWSRVPKWTAEVEH